MRDKFLWRHDQRKMRMAIDPKLVAPMIKPLLDCPDKELKGLKEWLLKQIALQCAVPKKNYRK